LRPRAINPDGNLKSADDWVLSKTLVQRGAALGANSTIRCGVTIGEWAMIGSGSVVTHDIPAYGLAWGNPARVHGFVCTCGGRLGYKSEHSQTILAICMECGREIEIPSADWKKAQ
jgi:UDP-2-acetamido-3-amino-2,3-dideoxy-glucuronate N-acetyltransferase